MGEAEPALGAGRGGVGGDVECDLAPIGQEGPDGRKDVGVSGRGEDVQGGGRVPGDLRLVVKRVGEEGDPFAENVEGNRGGLGRVNPHELEGVRVEVQLGPAGFGQRPLVGFAQLEVLSRSSDVQPDRWRVDSISPTCNGKGAGRCGMSSGWGWTVTIGLSCVTHGIRGSSVGVPGAAIYASRTDSLFGPHV